MDTRGAVILLTHEEIAQIEAARQQMIDSFRGVTMEDEKRDWPGYL